MLTLDSEQLERQRRIETSRRKRHFVREATATYIQKKETTVAADGGLCVSNLAEQLGLPLAGTEIERRLRLMNPRLIFEASLRYPDRMGIYIEEQPAGVLYLDAAVQKRMIVAMPIGMMPERTVKHVKRTRVPDPDIRGHWQEVEEFAGETRGWRTVLIRLLQAGLIQRWQVDRHFPANEKSKFWHQLVN